MLNPPAQQEARADAAGPYAVRPMDVVFADLFEYRGYHYLVVVDAFVSFPWVSRFRSAPTSPQVIGALWDIFSQHGLPSTLQTDGGPQYSAEEFLDFCRQAQ